jgi:hypothetical protein
VVAKRMMVMEAAASPAVQVPRLTAALEELALVLALALVLGVAVIIAATAATTAAIVVRTAAGPKTPQSMKRC